MSATVQPPRVEATGDATSAGEGLPSEAEWGHAGPGRLEHAEYLRGEEAEA